MTHAPTMLGKTIRMRMIKRGETMYLGQNKHSLLGIAAAAAIGWMAASLPASASGEARCAQQESLAQPSRAGAQSPLERMRRACPLLGRIVEDFAAQDLGEAFPAASPDPRSRAIATIAAFAALGDAASVKLHAKSALDAGATRTELEEMLYLTAVYAGAAKAIEATRALSDMLAEQPQDRCLDRSARADLRF